MRTSPRATPGEARSSVAWGVPELRSSWVSKEFLASDFIAEVELPYLLEAARAEGVRLLWLPVGYTLYETTPLREIQAIMDPKNPLDNLPDEERDAALKRIAEQVIDAYRVGPPLPRRSRLPRDDRFGRHARTTSLVSLRRETTPVRRPVFEGASCRVRDLKAARQPGRGAFPPMSSRRRGCARRRPVLETLPKYTARGAAANEHRQSLLVERKPTEAEVQAARTEGHHKAA